MLPGIIFFIAVILIFFFGAKHTDDNPDYLSRQTGVHLRGLACLLVLSAHAGIMNNAFEWEFSTLEGPWGVGVFFFLSGYGLIRSMNIDYMRGFLKRKYIKLWIPVFFLTPVYYIIYNYVIPTGGDEYLGLHNVVVSLLNGNTIVSGAWYILVMSCFYLAFKIAYEVSYRKENAFRAEFVLIVVLFYIVYTTVVIFGWWGAQWMVSPHMFIIGLIWGINEPRILKRHSNIIWVLIVSLIAAAAGVFLYESDSLYEWIIGITLTVTGFCGVLIFISSRFRVGNRITGFIGKHSFGIYMVHWLVFYIIRNYVSNPYLWFVISLSAGVIIGVAADKLFATISKKLSAA